MQRSRGLLVTRGRIRRREIPTKREIGQEMKLIVRKRARAQACATHSRHSKIPFPIFKSKQVSLRSTSNKLLWLDFSLDEKCEITLTCDESETVVSCVLYIPIGISQVVEQSF